MFEQIDSFALTESNFRFQYELLQFKENVLEHKKYFELVPGGILDLQILLSVLTPS